MPISYKHSKRHVILMECLIGLSYQIVITFISLKLGFDFNCMTRRDLI